MKEVETGAGRQGAGLYSQGRSLPWNQLRAPEIIRLPPASTEGDLCLLALALAGGLRRAPGVW